MSEEKNKIIIISPHEDDEIIGCFSKIIDKDNPPIILYVGNSPQERREEALKLKEYTNISIQIFGGSIPPVFMNPSTTFYFPDPSTEIHPLHRLWGSQGENMLRNGMDVIFYTTTMIPPYIHEVANPDKKEDLLNKVYLSQSNLWAFEKKYFLFEGYTKWLV